MTFLTHALSASILALMVTGVGSDQKQLVLTAFITAGLLDADHIFFYIKDRSFFRKEGFKGNLHKARSFLHEPVGILLMGILSLLFLGKYGTLVRVVYLSYLFHVIEDIIFGISYPFTPFNKKEFRLTNFGRKQKMWFEGAIVLSSLTLWWVYLK